MSHINLLPWRASLKKDRQRKRLIIAASLFLVALSMGYGWRVSVINAVNLENQRCHFLQVEIKKLDQQLNVINAIKTEKQRVIEHAQLIQKLETQRNAVVRLFNWLPKITPSGIALTSVSFTKNHVKIIGLTENNRLVSDMVRSIEQTQWFTEVTLPSITEGTVMPIKRYRFTLNFTLKLTV